MTGIYIGSTTPKSGKSLFTFSLGILLQRQHINVGYMKPLGRTYTTVDDSIGDMDAMVTQEILGQKALPHVLSPIMIPQTLHALAQLNISQQEALNTIEQSYTTLSAEKDIMLVAGTESFPATGSFCGADGFSITKHLGLRTILVERYDEHTNYDAVLYLKSILQNSLVGVILNDVPERAMHDATQKLAPYLASKGITVHGVVPRNNHLLALRIADLAHGLAGYIVAGNHSASKMVEGFVIGTMQVDNFMVHIRRHQGSAVIVGGDRTDLQLAALYSNCPCLILTGNFTPAEIIRAKAEELQIPLIVVKEDTYAVARTMSYILKTKKMRDLQQIQQGIDVVANNIQFFSLQQNLLQA